MSAQRPRDLARRTADALARRKREDPGFRRDTFCLPREAAREKARRCSAATRKRLT